MLYFSHRGLYYTTRTAVCIILLAPRYILNFSQRDMYYTSRTAVYYTTRTAVYIILLAPQYILYLYSQRGIYYTTRSAEHIRAARDGATTMIYCVLQLCESSKIRLNFVGPCSRTSTSTVLVSGIGFQNHEYQVLGAFGNGKQVPTATR